MMARARPGNGAGRANVGRSASGSETVAVDAAAFRLIKWLRAIPPRQRPDELKNWRRVKARAVCRERFMFTLTFRQDAIEVQENVADHSPGGGFGRSHSFREA